MFVHVSMSSFGRTTPTVALPRLCQTWSCSTCALLSPSECAPGCRIVSFQITRDSRDFYDSVCTVLFDKCNWLFVFICYSEMPPVAAGHTFAPSVLHNQSPEINEPWNSCSAACRSLKQLSTSHQASSSMPPLLRIVDGRRWLKHHFSIPKPVGISNQVSRTASSDSTGFGWGHLASRGSSGAPTKPGATSTWNFSG